MLTKKILLKTFQKSPEKYWKVELFDEKGFVRKVCPVCGKGYWTLDSGRRHCPDPNCGEEYGFIGSSITKRRLDYIEVWKLFEKFFKKNGHESIKRYPVITTWRKDLFFNIASIVNFQRFDDGMMTFDYPANPLIVPQVCLRFNDIQNVGVTGRHHTCFIMSGQHAFNPPEEGYWKDRCIELNFNFLTRAMGIPEEELIYVEDLWAMPDFSAFGPYIETFCRGLELVNSGFMQFTKSSNGFKDLPMKVIDVGWGHERLVWISNGTPTGYDVVFGPVIEKLKNVVCIEYDKDFFMKYARVSGVLNLEEIYDVKSARMKIAKKLGVSQKELEKKILPLEALYAIADHTKSLVFAIADGALPSNVGGGYNLRVLLRRALSFIEKFNWDLRLEEVATWHINYLKRMFPELVEHKDSIIKILNVEEERYENARKRARRIIQSLSGRKLTQEDLIRIYESEGLTPEQLGVDVSGDFYSRVTEKHMKPKIREKLAITIDTTGIPPTKVLYYDSVFNFKAKVLRVSGNFVILDRTAFYPESGGQACDLGEINGQQVISVKKVGSVIVHEMDRPKLKEGDVVSCSVDRVRRKILTIHHDAIHLINGAARKILGNHVHQYGAEKTVEKARIDLTHYQSLTKEEKDAIEELVNKVVEKGLPINKFILPRSEAERRYGFGIYQGGYVPSKNVRIVEIPGFDVEACGGTHGRSTKDVGYVTIIKTKRIADGLVRIEIKAGEVAVRYLKEKEKILRKVARQLGVNETEVPTAVENLFKEWKRKRKRLKKMRR